MSDSMTEGQMAERRLNDLLQGVDHSAKSNTKYRPLESYLGQLLSIDRELIYSTYISKAGNATVRFDQSARSRAARLLVALVDPPENETPGRTVETLERYRLDKRPDAEVLVLVREYDKWFPSTVIYPQSQKAPLVAPFIRLWGNLQVIEQSNAAHASRPQIRRRRLRFYVLGEPPTSPRVEYPYVELIRDRWDDFEFKTTFSVVVNIDASKSVSVGEVKILRRGQRAGATPLPSNEFDRLDQEYCSLGQSYSYYETLSKQLPKRLYSDLLRGLRDVVYDPRIRVAFEDEPGFSKSLTRTGRAARALEDAVPLFIDKADERRQTGLTFSFLTSVGGSPFEIGFSFNQEERLPDRINAIIGYNSTGKTQLLANIALVATSDLQQRRQFAQYGTIANSHSVRFGSVIAISYSAFDTFVLPDAFWRSGEAELAEERLQQKGEVFGYTYCGLRKRADSDRRDTRSPRGLKSITELTQEFVKALRMAQSSKKRPILIEAIAILRGEPSLARMALDPLNRWDIDEWHRQFDTLSTGHKVVLNIVVQIVAHSEPGSLILIDEPESHLHPSLLAALLRAINAILRGMDSYAIVATHSPVVLQEIPRRYVHILERFGQKTVVMEPLSETFGENVGYLTTNVFHLDSTQTDFHSVLERLAAEMTLDDIEALFDDDMSVQARAYLLGLKNRRRN